jgi:hypothetical protein
VEHWQGDRVRMGAGGGLLAGHLLKSQVLTRIQGAVLNTTRQEAEDFEKLRSEDWSGPAGVAGAAEAAEEAIESSQVKDTEMAQEDYNRVAVGPVHMHVSELADGRGVPDNHVQVETS